MKTDVIRLRELKEYREKEKKETKRSKFSLVGWLYVCVRVAPDTELAGYSADGIRPFYFAGYPVGYLAE